MPESRGRTSETRVGAIRPGSSRTIERARGWTTKMLTSGSMVCAAVVAVAEVGSSHPANNGDITASINAMHAGCARKPDIEVVAPDSYGRKKISRPRDVDGHRAGDARQNRAGLLRCNTFRGGSMSHQPIGLIYRVFF